MEDLHARELTQISDTAHQRAVAVSNDPTGRTPAIIAWAANTQERLIALAAEMGDAAKVPDAAHRISESILDLHFIEKNSSITSLRLGVHRARRELR